MQTIRLKVSDKIISKLMWFLGRFNKDEIQILNESSEFLPVQQYLESELLAMESGKRNFVGMDELEHHLEKSIWKFES